MKLSKLGNDTVIPVPDEYEVNYSSQFLNNFFQNKTFKEIEIKIRCRDSSNIIAFDSIPNFFSSSYNKPIEDILENTLADNNRNYNAISNVFDERPSIHLNSLTRTIQYHFFKSIVILYINLMQRG